MSDFPPGTVGYERRRIDGELARIANDARRDGTFRGRLAGWLIDRKRRKFQAEMDAKLHEGLKQAVHAHGYNWPPY